MLKRVGLTVAAIVALAFGSTFAWAQFGTAQPIKLLGLVIASCGGQSYSANSYAQITIDPTGSWCVTGAAPSGAAGGDLGGTYPNPTVVGASHLVGTITTTGTSIVLQGGGNTGTLTWAPSSSGKTIVLPNGSTDFTGTGGANQVVKQSGSGAAFTVGTLATTNLSDITSAGSWTPVDGSAGSLTFSNAVGSYNKIGNMIFASGFVTYPSTVSGAVANIAGFTTAFPSASNAKIGPCSISTNAAAIATIGLGSTSSMSIYNLTAQVAITNAQLTGANVVFNCVYPAS